MADVKKQLPLILEKMQQDMFAKAKKFLQSSIVEVKTWKDFEKAAKENKLIKTIHCAKEDCEDEIKEKTQGVSSRCIPLNSSVPKGKCIHCGNKAEVELYFSRSY